ncbi:bifunctional riboflavin kinase/FAD synthetase [Rarobacter faecitabidus]|uniref:Riboflavin biosynthesis protein n=1 Tax=Rarobacter faecitabidus TaxID=13243 RepID=A0A542ZWF0_RARFA|nr:bifunctional riboflavin kinase/FAD synthetase [Rarobacter faecitabidus]TQL64668.1 riboflavin kinase/FMN adenylyltransferase [Rarobacter faecitabidus]
MQVFNGIGEVPANFGPSVVTIGNFDGVHRGHRKVLEQVAAIGRANSLTSVAMTFDPHPAVVHNPSAAPEPICDLPQRLRLLAETGIDATLVVPYALDFARQTPEGFVLTYLVGVLGMRTIVAGRDIRFGWQNAGDIATMRSLADEYGFDVVEIADVGSADAGDRWSSTKIRELIATGDVARAGEMLGRSPFVEGEVVHGDHRGRELGFPTANLGQVRGQIPADGVYAGWLTAQHETQAREDVPGRAAVNGADIADGRLPAAISVGTNPTFGENARRIEAFVLDATGLDLYGQDIVVEFVAKVRGQATFASAAELIERMHADVAEVRRILG